MKGHSAGKLQKGAGFKQLSFDPPLSLLFGYTTGPSTPPSSQTARNHCFLRWRRRPIAEDASSAAPLALDNGN